MLSQIDPNYQSDGERRCDVEISTLDTQSTDGPKWAQRSGDDEYGPWANANICGVLVRMRWIEPGSFLMGSADSDREAFYWEKPQHQVDFSTGFWMSQTPCTQELWLATMGLNPSRFKGARHPVEEVSWNDVKDFLQAANMKNPSLDLKLPTEAQWEYAARAGSNDTRYGTLDEIAWYKGNSDSQTCEVGLKRPNAWGLHDMLGNVWEWCHDWYGAYDSAHSVDPVVSVKSTSRVVRGGSWRNSADSIRVTYRHCDDPIESYGDLGFRFIICSRT